MNSHGRRNFIKKSGLAFLPLSFAINPVPAFVPQQKKSRQQKRDGEKKIILLRSSWNDYNVGDIGHTPGTLRLIERYIPEADVLLWHESPRPITEALVARYFPRVKIVRGSFMQKDTPLEGDLKTAFDKAGVYIQNSGMGFNYGLFNYEWNGLIGNLSPMLYCIDKGIPCGTYGQSYDKFAPPSMLFYRDVMNRLSFVYCREKESVRFLQDNDFKSPVLEFGPDGCFGIDVVDDAQGTAYLDANKLEKGKFLVINIRTNTSKDDKPGDLMNPVSTPEKREEDRRRLAKVKALITYWVRKSGQKVLIIPEAQKEGRQAKIQLYDTLDNDVKEKVVCRQEWWTNADEAMGIIKYAHTAFGMEPHTLIMALTLGVPILHARPVSNGRKGWMFRDIGLPEWLFDIDKVTADELVAALSEIMAHYAAAKEKVNTAMSIVKDRQEKTMQYIKTLI